MFGPSFIQPPVHFPFKNPIGSVDNPSDDFRDGEVRGMNQDHLDDLALQEAGHNDQ